MERKISCVSAGMSDELTEEGDDGNQDQIDVEKLHVRDATIYLESERISDE